jgi:hypothetical protein
VKNSYALPENDRSKGARKKIRALLISGKTLLGSEEVQLCTVRNAHSVYGRDGHYLVLS